MLFCEVGASLIGTVANSVEGSIVTGVCIVPKELQVACVGRKWSGEGWKGKSAKKKNDGFMRTEARREAVLGPIFDVILILRDWTQHWTDTAHGSYGRVAGE